MFFDPEEDVVKGLNLAGWIIAGLLVGFGTKLGNGCPSGHGVCGLARQSCRSFMAVPTFVAFAIAMASLRYYLNLLNNGQYFGDAYSYSWKWISFGMFCTLCCIFLSQLLRN